LLPLQAKEVTEYKNRLAAADAANRILAGQERIAREQADAARDEAKRARDDLAVTTNEIK
jgi:hypothetical protein